MSNTAVTSLPASVKENRLDIWENFVELLKPGSEDIDFVGIERKLKRLARHRLNGRQTKNTWNTARQLAQFRRQRLEYDHVGQAITWSSKYASPG